MDLTASTKPVLNQVSGPGRGRTLPCGAFTKCGWSWGIEGQKGIFDPPRAFRAMTGKKQELEMIRSRDGTGIAAFRTGAGPPLVLVHGAPADHTRWRPVLPGLERSFTCYAVDRRGRGASGDTPPYSLEKEAQDVAAVMDALPEPGNLLGHSYGGLCSLEAAARTRNLRRLILYEALAVADETIYPPGSIERLERMLAAGEREQMLVTMLREIAGMPEPDIAVLRSLPAWKNRLAAAAALPRELRVDQSYRLDSARAARIHVPTLILLGGASPAMYRTAAQQLNRSMPGSRIAVLPGQGHAAMDTGTDLFVNEVERFLKSSPRPSD